jgi:hypothetical protein
MLIVVLIVLISGITFGIKLTGATKGTDGMAIITFALSFLSIVLSFLIFTQLMHLKEHMAKLTETKEEIKFKRKLQ